MAEDEELHEFYLSCKDLEIISMALDADEQEENTVMSTHQVIQ